MKRVLILVLLVAMAGCQFVPSSSVQVPQDISTGTDALVMDFTPTATTNLLMCQQANIVAMFRNKGTSDIINGIYSLITEDQVLTQSGDNSQKQLSLVGKSKFNPEGGISQVQFKLKNSGLPPQLETYTTPAILQACYQYQTLAPIPVCVDPDVMNTNPQKVCHAVPVYPGGGQGAPIAITKVEPNMVPFDTAVVPSFTIYIANMGSGRVISPDSVLAACTSRQGGPAPQAKVQVSASLQDEQLTCTPQTVLLTGSTESKFVCQSSRNFGKDQGTFTSLLQITVDYGYVNTATIPLTINRIGGQASCQQPTTNQ